MSGLSGTKMPASLRDIKHGILHKTDARSNPVRFCISSGRLLRSSNFTQTRQLLSRNDAKAFTLAEVLITLGIIGVVAGITIPTLMHSTQEQEFKTGYRKAYSVISQALQKANADNVLTPFSGAKGGVGLQTNFQALEQYFSIAKACDTSHLSDCWDTSSRSEDYRNETFSLSFIDKSGMTWRTRTSGDSSDGNNIPTILVDINGFKFPNKYGQDRFPFYFSNTVNNNPTNSNFIISGIPTKIVPNVDVDASNIDTGGTSNTCPSYATHPCYYTSWLYN